MASKSTNVAARTSQQHHRGTSANTNTCQAASDQTGRMTFVPWEKYNICKLYALPRTSCKARQCKYEHPPQEDLWRIWDLHDESRPTRGHGDGELAVTSDGYGRPHSRDFEKTRGEPAHTGRPEQMLDHREEPVRDDYHWQTPSRAPMDIGMHPDRTQMLIPGAKSFSSLPAMAEPSSLERRFPGPSPLPFLSSESTWHEREAPRALPWQSEPRGVEIAPNAEAALPTPARSGYIHYALRGNAPASDSEPPAVTKTDRWRPGSREADLQQERRDFSGPRPTPERRAPRVPTEANRSEILSAAIATASRPPAQTARGQPRDQHLNPALSSNEFINGASVYRFVWGNPLCVRCGKMGKAGICKNEPLSVPEQDYLYRLMRAEQARSKMEDPKPLPRQKYFESPSREQSVEPQSVWQRPPSYSHDRDRPDRSQSGSEEPGGSSHWQCYREQEENGLPQRDKDNVTQAQEGMPLRAGHKRNFNDFSDFMDGTRDDVYGTTPTGPDREVKIRGMSQVKKEASVKVEEVEVGLPTALAPSIASTTSFVHPSRAALVASPLLSGPPLIEASVPLNTPSSVTMGATKRMSNGEAKIIGPHPSTIRVSASYITQAAIDKRLAPEGLDAQERSLAEAREDTVRLQGVAWLDNVRRHLQLPVKTFTTAVVYYHKFRLAHPKEDYQWIDAAAASLLTSCKNEDTLKKSRDILAAAYNMKLPSNQEQAATDDPMFETQSRMVIGIERLILESGGFDFRSRAPHHTLVKIGKSLPKSPDVKEVSQLAWTVLTDLHRTFAPLKQTSSTLALASLELAAHFTAAKSEHSSCIVRDNLQELDLSKWHTTREEVMETLLDGLDLYTHNTGSSILGSKYSLDDLLRIRLALNKECSDSSLPRYTVIQPPPSPDNANDTSNTLRVANGHPTPVSPPQPGAQVPQPVNAFTATSQHTPQTDGTLRFMLNPQRATEERADVNRYYTEEWEEYEEEIEVPLPRDHSRERDRERDREREGSSRRDRDRGRERDSGRPRDFHNRRNGDDRSNGDRRTVRDSPRAAPAAPREPKVARQQQPSNMLQSVVRAPSPAPEIITQQEDEKDSHRDRERESDRARDRPRSRDRERRYDADRRHDERDRYDSRRDRGSRDDRDRTSGGGGSRRHYDDDRRRDRR